MTDRRAFLTGLVSVAGASAARAWDMPVFAKAAADYDENLTVLVSDPHLVKAGSNWDWVLKGLADTIGEILKMKPLPRRAVFFGDLVLDNGGVAHYEFFRSFLKLLEDAGIRTTLTLGNHDRRGDFLAVFPEYAKRTLVPGRVVTVTPLGGGVELLLLDSLQAADGAAKGPGPGALNQDEQDYLAAKLPQWKHPVLVGAHHQMDDDLSVHGQPLVSLFDKSPKVRGYLHGHRHRWLKSWMMANWDTRFPYRSLGLPTTGYGGEIGFASLRVLSDRVRVTAHIRDFYRPQPVPKAERPAAWDMIVADEQGQFCDFPLI